MPDVSIKTGGNIPTGDGDINLYESPELKGTHYFDRSRQVIFVNGMDNTPQNHKASAEALSTLQCCPVIGVYNQTDGFWKDLGQCLSDKLTLVAPQSGAFVSFNLWGKLFDNAYESAKAKQPSLTKADYMERAISSNKATLALYRLVRGAGARLPIFSHSQGNLITSNMLTAVALVDGPLQNCQVHSFGSPCRFWPPGIQHFNHAFTFDPVGWMDYKFSFSSIKVGGVAAHSFTQYMRYDPEFLINRFRWGSFGFTANMDEDGLANALVEIGLNPERLLGIFKRLYDAHWSDRDDVTLAYVNKMRSRGHEATLKSLATTKPEVIVQMVKCLVGGVGYNSPEEIQQANYLRSLSPAVKQLV